MATVLFNINSGNLNLESMMQLLPTPDRWLQVMKDLDIYLDYPQDMRLSEI
jgi:hypothetical protein